MKSSVLGKNTSGAEVQDITQAGVWVYVKGKEYMLPFTQYPWFKGAKVSEVLNLRLLHANHLYWPDLDVDVAVDSIDHPEDFPLVGRARPKRRIQPTRRKRVRG